MNIYVSNIQFKATQKELESLFSAYGTVESAKIVTDRETGRSRGFGFVEMPDITEAKAAINALNGHEFLDRALTVNEAKAKPSKS